MDIHGVYEELVRARERIVKLETDLSECSRLRTVENKQTARMIQRARDAEGRATRAEIKLAAAQEEARELESRLHPKCTCERCTGMKSPEDFYENTED